LTIKLLLFYYCVWLTKLYFSVLGHTGIDLAIPVLIKLLFPYIN